MPTRENYMIAQTASGRLEVRRDFDNQVLGYATTQFDINVILERDALVYDRKKAEHERLTRVLPPGPMFVEPVTIPPGPPPAPPGPPPTP